MFFWKKQNLKIKKKKIKNPFLCLGAELPGF